MTQPHAASVDRAVLRAEVLARRSSSSGSQRRVDDQARTQRLLELLEHFGSASRRPRVASYLAKAPEPDTLDFARLWGDEILVPVFDQWLTSRMPKWSVWHPSAPLTTSLAGIPVPADAVEASPDLLQAVDVVIVSALLADPRGNRLGTGGGWFDRALPEFRTDALRVCLLNDDELVDQLVPQAHDEPIDVVITPNCTLTTSARN